MERFVSCFFFTANRSTRGRMVMPWRAGECQTFWLGYPGRKAEEPPFSLRASISQAWGCYTPYLSMSIKAGL